MAYKGPARTAQVKAYCSGCRHQSSVDTSAVGRRHRAKPCKNKVTRWIQGSPPALQDFPSELTNA